MLLRVIRHEDPATRGCALEHRCVSGAALVVSGSRALTVRRGTLGGGGPLTAGAVVVAMVNTTAVVAGTASVVAGAAGFFVAIAIAKRRNADRQHVVRKGAYNSQPASRFSHLSKVACGRPLLPLPRAPSIKKGCAGGIDGCMSRARPRAERRPQRQSVAAARRSAKPSGAA